MLEIYDEIRSEPHKADRMTLRERVFVALGIACFFILLGIAVPAMAEPIYRASDGQVSITLYNEACKLPAVENLQKRAVWVENGKETEGCWGAHPAFPVVMFYFADKSVVIVPTEGFQKVTGA